jgi:hypothetical protein
MFFCSHVTTTKKKAREKAGHGQNLLPNRTASGHGLFRSCDFVTSGQKTTTGTDMAQLPCTLLRVHLKISTYKNVFFNIFTLLMFKIRQQLTKIKSIALCKTAFIVFEKKKRSAKKQ